MPTHEDIYKDVPKLADRFKTAVDAVVAKGVTSDELLDLTVNCLMAHNLGYLDYSDMRTIVSKACRDAVAKKK